MAPQNAAVVGLTIIWFFCLKYLKKFYTGTKEQKTFVNNLLIHMQTTPKCYEKLNVEDYTLNKFCLIDRVRDYFDYEKFLPALEELNK